MGLTQQSVINGAGNYCNASGNKALCRTRYGAGLGDTIWAAEQSYNTVGYDNGVDGLFLGRTYTSTTYTTTGSTAWDNLVQIPVLPGTGSTYYALNHTGALPVAGLAGRYDRLFYANATYRGGSMGFAPSDAGHQTNRCGFGH